MSNLQPKQFPRPTMPGHYVQGTLPPQNWGHFNGLPKGYEGPATVGQQHPESDNFKRISPAYNELQRESADEDAARAERQERFGYERKWRNAGQQAFFRDPYSIEGPEDWERPR